VSLTVLFSSFSSSSAGVLLGTGGTVGAAYILGLFPFARDRVPTLLMDGNSLIFGLRKPEDYAAALAVTLGLTAASFLLAIPIFDRKKL
ncbi:MAG: ABC transporter permease, partial [Clostridia bacterium]|nr:ABC transporter permease [Clostridia bacterium]